jgi:hypothetical protein
VHIKKGNKFYLKHVHLPPLPPNRTPKKKKKKEKALKEQKTNQSVTEKKAEIAQLSMFEDFNRPDHQLYQ